MVIESYRDKLLNALESGNLSAQAIVEMFIAWNTSNDIKEMLQSNDIDIIEY